MFNNVLLLADQGAAQNAGLLGYLPIVLLIVVMGGMIFFSSRSQKKQERETNKMRDELAPGDEITTIGGIIGKVVRIKDETVLIETGRQHVQIRILKSAVRSVDVKAEDAKN